MIDSEPCSNWIQLDFISILDNFSCDFGQIMTRYDFQESRWVILSNVRTDYNFIWFHFWSSLDNLFLFLKYPKALGVHTTIDSFAYYKAFDIFFWSHFWPQFRHIPPPPPPPPSKCKMAQIWPFWPLKLAFRIIQPNPNLYSTLVPS